MGGPVRRRRRWHCPSRALEHARVVIDHARDGVLAFPPGARLPAERITEIRVVTEAPHREAERVLQIHQIERDSDSAIVGVR